MHNKSTEPAVQELIEEIVAAFRQLRIAAADLHGEGVPMPGQRGVLLDLASNGPQTVAAMARTRGVSRQHVQVMMDGFRTRGLVEGRENPAHRRAKLMDLTPAGRALVRDMVRRERAALRALHLEFSPAHLRTTVSTIRNLRHRLADAYPANRSR